VRLIMIMTKARCFLWLFYKMLAGTIIEQKVPVLNINLSGLPAAMRRPVWDWMLEHRPAVCEWLKGDQCMMFKDTFNDIGCTPVLDLNQKEADALMQQIPGLARYAI